MSDQMLEWEILLDREDLSAEVRDLLVSDGIAGVAAAPGAGLKGTAKTDDAILELYKLLHDRLVEGRKPAEGFDLSYWTQGFPNFKIRRCSVRK